ncbi:MAG: alpha/beta fold hydrolase [Patescibacteria group bacterium]
MEKIIFTAKDGVKIAADLYFADNPRGWIIMVHMMPETKESYSDLALEFQSLGYESLAIDLRGHGESDGGLNGFLNFSDEEHQKSILDLEGAVEWLKNKGAKPEKIYFIGASIGANLSLQYLAEHHEFKKAILLSPGLDYRGIKTEPLVKHLKAGQEVFFASAKDDIRSGGNNADMNEKLFDFAPVGVKKEIKIYETGGHGTDILKNQSSLEDLVVNFINI